MFKKNRIYLLVIPLALLILSLIFSSLKKNKENFEGFSEPRSGIEKPRSFIDVTELRSVKSTNDDKLKEARKAQVTGGQRSVALLPENFGTRKKSKKAKKGTLKNAKN